MYHKYVMATFTSSLPNNLLALLDNKSKELGIPKNKIIEKALSIYLDQLNRAAYVKSYQNLGNEQATILLAEEGMVDYLKQLHDADDDQTR
jgi:hypothetical protein